MKAINLIPLHELKAVYFDADGVLSIPVYPLGQNGKSISFAENPRWTSFVSGNPDAYDQCMPPASIKDWIARLKENNIPTYVLSCSVEAEIPAKMKFLEQNYHGMFDDIYIVHSPSQKIQKMLKDLPKHGCEKFEMALVEDNHYALFEASEYGFRGIHVSWFMDVAL